MLELSEDANEERCARCTAPIDPQELETREYSETWMYCKDCYEQMVKRQTKLDMSK